MREPYAEGLLRLAAPELARRLDFTRIEYVRRTFISKLFRKKESDLVLRIPYEEDPQLEILVYLLIELQATPDSEMALRLLLYVGQLIQWQMLSRKRGERLSPVVPVLFYHGPQEWKQDLKVSTLFHGGEIFSRYIPQGEFVWFDLCRNLHQLERSDHPIASVLSVLARDRADLPELELALAQAVERLDRLDPGQRDIWERAIWFLITLIEHRRTPEETDRLLGGIEEKIDDRNRKEEVTHMVETAAEAHRREGIEQGIEQGRQALQKTLLSMLRKKFGELPAS